MESRFLQGAPAPPNFATVCATLAMPSILLASMSRPGHLSAVLCLAASLLLAAFDARAQPAAQRDATAALRTPQANLYTAGPTVRISAPVAGDLFAAGGQLIVEQPVARDAALAGGDVALNAPVAEDLRAAGGQVSIDAAVGGEAHLAAGRLRIGRSGSVAGAAWLAGGEVEMLGRLAGGSSVHAGQAHIDGPVDGDLTVRAGSLSLGPRARIAGRLNYQSREPLQQDPQAVVSGPVVREPLPERTPPPAPSSGIEGALLWLVGLMLAGVVWRLVFPVQSRSAEASLADRPWRSLGIGALVVLATPPAAVLLLVTVVGAPLALAAIAAYALLLLLGYLVTAGALGERLLRDTGRVPNASRAREALALAAALLALMLIGWLPWLGWLVSLAAAMAGIGSLVDRLVVRLPASATA